LVEGPYYETAPFLFPSRFQAPSAK